MRANGVDFMDEILHADDSKLAYNISTSSMYQYDIALLDNNNSVYVQQSSVCQFHRLQAAELSGKGVIAPPPQFFNK